MLWGGTICVIWSKYPFSCQGDSLQKTNKYWCSRFTVLGWWWKWSMWSPLVLDQHLHLTWSILRWPVYVVDLKAVHHVRLDHISGSLPIRPMPLIIVHIYWNARRYNHEDHVLLLTSSLSVTVSPLWCPLSHPCQDTIKLPYSTNVITSKSKNNYLSKKHSCQGIVPSGPSYLPSTLNWFHLHYEYLLFAVFDIEVASTKLKNYSNGLEKVNELAGKEDVGKTESRGLCWVVIVEKRR